MFRYSPDGIGAKVRYCYQSLNVTAASKNANYVANVISEMFESEYLSDGTLLETHTFWIFLTDSTGAIIFSTYQTVKIYSDVYLGKYYIVNT